MAFSGFSSCKKRLTLSHLSPLKEMNLTETINYIETAWPQIMDANSCARWLIKISGAGNGGLYASTNIPQINRLCRLWEARAGY